MNFFEAIKICFSKYVDFTGRAPRSEYWWFVLFVIVLAVVFTEIDPVRVFIFHLGVLLPQLAVSVRRLHDINRSGYHDTKDTLENIDLDYGAALAAIAIETVARVATLDSLE